MHVYIFLILFLKLISIFKLVRFFLIFIVFITLLACGGGSSTSQAPSVIFSNDFVLDFPYLSEGIKAELDTEYTSSEITLSGFESDVPVSITNGLYQLNGEGDFVSAEGIVNSGDTIIVKAVSSSSFSTTTAVSLSIGSGLSLVNSIFNITTLGDTVGPEVTILFPPALSLTDGPEVYIRGTATNNLSGMQSLMINGVSAEDTSEDGSFSTWEATIPLKENQENTLTVEAKDNANNIGLASVLVVQDNVEINFPNDDNPFPSVNYGAMAWDELRQTIWISNNVNGTVYGVDIATGNRTSLNAISVNDSEEIQRSDAILLSPDGDHLWSGSAVTGDIYEIDLIDSEDSTAGTRRLKWSSTAGEEGGIDIENVRGLTFPLPNPEDNTELMVTTNNAVVALNIETNSRRYFFSDNFSDSVSFFSSLSSYLLRDLNNKCWLLLDSGHEINVGVLYCVNDDDTFDVVYSDTVPDINGSVLDSFYGMTLDTERNVLFFPDIGNNQLYSLQLSNSDRGKLDVFSDDTTPNSYNRMNRFHDVIKLDDLDYLFAMDFSDYKMLAVDLKTGSRVVVSRGKRIEQFD